MGAGLSISGMTRLDGSIRVKSLCRRQEIVTERLHLVALRKTSRRGFSDSAEGHKYKEKTAERSVAKIKVGRATAFYV